MTEPESDWAFPDPVTTTLARARCLLLRAGPNTVLKRHLQGEIDRLLVYQSMRVLGWRDADFDLSATQTRLNAIENAFSSRD